MSTIRNPVELRQRALEILVRELGYADAMRFLLQYEAGAGDYTQERARLVPDCSLAEMISEADKLAEPSR